MISYSTVSAFWREAFKPEQPQMNAKLKEEFREWIKAQRYGEAGTYTPDIVELELHPRVPIFVHDEMLPGGINHDMVTETNLKGRWPSYSGFTEDTFHMWHRRLGTDSYAVALKADNVPQEHDRPEWAEDTRQKPGKIWGNIYHIRPYAFKKLDFVKANGVEFKRTKVNITVPIQKTFYKALPEVSHEMKYVIPCYMYIGNPDFFNPLIDGGFEFIPVQQINYTAPRARDWLDRYYVYRYGNYK